MILGFRVIDRNNECVNEQEKLFSFYADRKNDHLFIFYKHKPKKGKIDDIFLFVVSNMMIFSVVDFNRLGSFLG